MNEFSECDRKTAAKICEYERVRPAYERLVEEVVFVMTEKVNRSGVRVANVSDPANTLESFKEKLRRKRCRNPSDKE